MLNHSLVPVGSTGYDIDNSLRFNDNDSAYLSRTPSTAGNRKTWTWSGWVKRGNLGTDQRIFGQYTTGGTATATSIYFGTNNKFQIADWADTQLYVDRVFRDTSAWLHIIVAWDTTQSTETNRVKVYINGEQQTLIENVTGYPSLNLEKGINTTLAHNIGSLNPYYAGQYLDGYIAEVNFVDGQALTPADFGETGDYGEWKPIEYAGTYGTNGFYLDFKTSGSLGNDANGSNNWTPNNLAATDQMLDSPTNNFCTWNPLNQSTGVALREGNTNMYLSSNDQASTGTFGIDSGKWYVEAYYPSGDNPEIGLIPSNQYLSNRATVGANSYEQTAFITNGGAMRTGSWATTSTTGLSAQTGGGVIGIAIDADNDKMWFTNTSGTYFNSGNPATGLNPQATFDSDWVTQTGGVFFYSLIATGSGNFIISNFGQDSSFAGNKTAQGNADGNGYGDFYYTPPTGFLALCTQNLPEPTVVPSEHFNTVTYTGNGTDNTSITGVGFQPDFTWIKNRTDSSSSNNALSDSVRGTPKTLHSDGTWAESTFSGHLKTLDADGFTLGTSNYVNGTSDAMVAWNWKANGAGVSNTNGTITSTVSANADAGFSIVSYTGTGSSATVGHGLSKAPELIIAKNRGHSADWAVGGNVIGSWSDKTLELNNTVATVTDSNIFGADPTTSLFTIGTSWKTNRSGYNHIAYCFHSVEGYSKVGSYTGNGATGATGQGPFVNLGFRPAFIMIKRSSSSSAYTNWVIYDSKRDGFNQGAENSGGNKYVYADSPSAEANTYILNTFSNGFTIYDNYDVFNSSGSTYIYLAFAENPFKYTNAR